MSFLNDVFRVFMYILPFTLCIAAYAWMAKKAWRVPHKVLRVVALVIIAAGLGYTVYRLIRSIGTIMTNDNFEYIIFIVTVAVLALASIVMAFGEPEDDKPAIENKPSHQGKENGLEQ